MLGGHEALLDAYRTDVRPLCAQGPRRRSAPPRTRSASCARRATRSARPRSEEPPPRWPGGGADERRRRPHGRPRRGPLAVGGRRPTTRSARSCSPRTCSVATARWPTSAAATPRRRATAPTTSAARSDDVGQGLRLATSRRWGRATSPPLRLDEMLPLFERDEMSDEDMVAHLAPLPARPRRRRAPRSRRCCTRSSRPPHVHHTHPDGINVIAGAADGERLIAECFGDEAAWIPYIRPGFTLAQAGRRGRAREPGAAARRARQARPRRVGRHAPRRRTGARSRSINQAVEFVNARTAATRRASAASCAGRGATARARCGRCCPRCAARSPASRRRCSIVDTSPRVLEFVGSRDAESAHRRRRRLPRPPRAHQARAAVDPLRPGGRRRRGAGRADPRARRRLPRRATAPTSNGHADESDRARRPRRARRADPARRARRAPAPRPRRRGCRATSTTARSR